VADRHLDRVLPRASAVGRQGGSNKTLSELVNAKTRKQ
jgi:hypothetical protein